MGVSGPSVCSMAVYGIVMGHIYKAMTNKHCRNAGIRPDMALAVVRM